MANPVACEVEYADLDNDRGGTQDGVRLECSKCGHTEESFGTHSGSIKRCLALMRENCPGDEGNYYEADQ